MNKTIPANSERKGEVPEAFRRIRATLMECRPKPYDRYSRDGLEAERNEAAKELRDFWYKWGPGPITDRRRKLFEDSYRWSERHYFAAVENRIDRNEEPFHPSEKIMRVFVLLSDPGFCFENQELIRHMFDDINWHGEINEGLLVRMLNPDALKDLLYSIDGENIANLLIGANQYDVSHRDTELVEKLVGTFGLDAGYLLEREVGNYIILAQSSSVIGILRRARSKKAHAIADFFVKRLELARKGIQEVLDVLKGNMPSGA